VARRRADGRRVLLKPPGHRGRRGVSAHHRLQLRGLRDRVREFEHVSGDGQHHPVAHYIRCTHRDRRNPGVAARAVAWLHAAMDLVYLCGRRRRATGDQSLAAATRVPRTFELRHSVENTTRVISRVRTCPLVVTHADKHTRSRRHDRCMLRVDVASFFYILYIRITGVSPRITRTDLSECLDNTARGTQCGPASSLYRRR